MPVLAQAPGSPECKRQLFFAEPALKQARDRLRDGADAAITEKCELWRGYSAALKSSRAVFGRCLAEPLRARRLAETAGASAEIDGAIAAQCQGARKGAGKGPAGTPGIAPGNPARLVPSQ